jgi:ABC-type multidrug transport system permease subunit
MPLFFILILGLLLGEGFGQKTDNRLRVSLVIEDQGQPLRKGVAWFLLAPGPVASPGPLGSIAALACQNVEPWSRIVERDLADTADIRVEIIGSRAEAERLVQAGSRPAVLVLGPHFSERVDVCSFLTDGVNPFYRDGVDLGNVDAHLLRDPAQITASSIIEQVAQVSMLRVILPWMIGRAFERLSDDQFINTLGTKVHLPVPREFQVLLQLRGIKLDDKGQANLNDLLRVAADNPAKLKLYRDKVGLGVQGALSEQFKSYNLLGKTWAALTKADPRTGQGAGLVHYVEEGGTGVLRRGAARYQLLVPAYTVMFAFSLVLTVGWLFVLERRQGTLKRLRAAPISRSQVLMGKFLPCLAVSVLQGIFLLAAGRLLFGMRWGPASWSLGQQVAALLPVVLTTSFAATGLGLLLAGLARTEIQVALVGSLLVLVLALLSGCLIPRELLPDTMIEVSRITPHAWALDAYRQLLVSPSPGLQPVPNLHVVTQACLVLLGFGAGFLLLAWAVLRLD